MSTTHSLELLQDFKKIQSLVRKNTYIRDTSSKLERIIEDAEANTQIIFVGKERVGKSTIINALLGKNVFPTEITEPTKVNIFIKYDTEERIEVVFYDGFVATFGLNKLQMIVNAQIEAAEIIREHIQYIQVFLNNALLKNVTLVDTHSFELVNNDSIYFSELLLNRVDEIFWVTRAGTPMSDDEIAFMRRVASRFMKPHIVMTAIDEIKGKAETFLAQERARYGAYSESFHMISSKFAIEARLENNMQKLIDSNIQKFVDAIQELAKDHTRKEHHIFNQLSQWLSRFRKEMELIIAREPYLSALDYLKKHEEEKQLEFSKEQRDLAIIKAYEDDYKQTAQLFKNVQTLYQLLQAIGNHLMLRDVKTEAFEELASRYLEELRNYRNLYSEYEMQYKKLEKYIKSVGTRDGNAIIHLSSKADHGEMSILIDQMNTKKELLVVIYDKIRNFESQLEANLAPVVDELNEKVKQQLKKILNQVTLLNDQRKTEFATIQSSQYKLKEFDCIVEAQRYISGQLKQTLQQMEDFLPEETKQEMDQTIKFIEAIEFEHQNVNLVDTDETDQNLTKPIVVTFERDYPIMMLKMEKDDILSTIENVPLTLELA